MKEGKFPLLWELDVSGKILDEGKLDIGNELDDKCVTDEWQMLTVCTDGATNVVPMWIWIVQ